MRTLSRNHKRHVYGAAIPALLVLGLLSIHAAWCKTSEEPTNTQRSFEICFTEELENSLPSIKEGQSPEKNNNSTHIENTLVRSGEQNGITFDFLKRQMSATNESQNNVTVMLSINDSDIKAALADPAVYEKFVNRIKKTVKAAQTASKEPVTILIPGQINRYNFEAFENATSSSRAVRLAQKLEDQTRQMVNKAVEGLPETKEVTVQSLMATPVYQQTYQDFRSAVMANPELEKRIDSVAEAFLKKRGKSATPERMDLVRNYIFEELPLLSHGVPMVDKISRNLVHMSLRPVPLRDQPLTSFIEDLNDLKNPEFDKLREILGLDKPENIPIFSDVAPDAALPIKGVEIH